MYIHAYIRASDDAAAPPARSTALAAERTATKRGRNRGSTHASLNQDISAWNVGSVTSMYEMCRGTTISFNASLGDRKMGQVTRMLNMFVGSGFDCSISAWDVSA